MDLAAMRLVHRMTICGPVKTAGVDKPLIRSAIETIEGEVLASTMIIAI